MQYISEKSMMCFKPKCTPVGGCIRFVWWLKPLQWSIHPVIKSGCGLTAKPPRGFFGQGKGYVYIQRVCKCMHNHFPSHVFCCQAKLSQYHPKLMQLDHCLPWKKMHARDSILCTDTFSFVPCIAGSHFIQNEYAPERSGSLRCANIVAPKKKGICPPPTNQPTNQPKKTDSVFILGSLVGSSRGGLIFQVSYFLDV